MPISHKLAVIHECLTGLEADGYSVYDTTDFEGAIAKLIENGKSYLTPNMSPFDNDFTADNCFWVMLTFDGQEIGGIAARRDRLGTETLGSFWRRAMRRQYGEGKRDQVIRVSEFIDKEVSGDITYFGDLLLHEKHQGFGSHLRFFTMYAQITAALRWDTDWTYSFVSQSRAERGGAFTYGFAKTIPGAQEWSDAPKTRSSTECCVISSRADINDIATYFSRFRDQLRVVKDTLPTIGQSDRSKSA